MQKFRFIVATGTFNGLSLVPAPGWESEMGD